jgi:hypothetical protein
LGTAAAPVGHDVRLISPQYVKAYLKRVKNDAADAAAICEAATRRSMRFVPIKSEEQQGVLIMPLFSRPARAPELGQMQSVDQDAVKVRRCCYSHERGATMPPVKVRRRHSRGQAN